MRWCNVSSVMVMYLLLLPDDVLALKESVIKYLTSDKERVRIGCPHRHVIYHPSVYAGVSGTGAFSRASTDCTGTPRRLQKLLDKCYLKKYCDLTLKKADTITCGNDVENAQRKISYVVFEKMYCVPKEFVMTMCRLDTEQADNLPNHGIIRSHKHYPRRQPKSRLRCQMTIPLRPRDSIIIDIYDDKVFNMLNVFVVSRTSKAMVKVYTKDMIKLHGNTTAAILISADFRWKRRHIRGFMMSYSIYPSKLLDSYYEWPSGVRPAFKQLGWVTEVRAVTEQCAAETKGQIQLLCDQDEVIYYPALSVSGHTRRKSTSLCIPGKYPCGGATVDLLVQENDCYWKNKCKVNWRGDERIILSSDSKCIGLRAAMLGHAGHRCVNPAKIYDICTNKNSTIDSSWGIVRSHPNYPWLVGVECEEFERKIKVGRKFGITIVMQDIELDQDGKDTFVIYHIVKEGATVKQRLVSNPKEGQRVHAKGGVIVVYFRRHKRSNGGRGIILVFHRFPVSKREIDYTEAGSPKKDVLSDDTRSDMPRLSNWRLCSEGSRLRKKGKSCNRRVWTDYYKRRGY